MIKVEHIEIFNLDGAIRGMRNPLNSHDKSDSHMCFGVGEEHCGYVEKCGGNCCYEIGENDLALMRKLCRAGSDHRKFLRQILVSMDIIAPLYWWKEFDTYKVGTVANSCSTMHTIHKRELTMEDFSCEHLMTKEKQMLKVLINLLNEDIMVYNADTNQKAFWWQLIQLLPSSFNQKRTVTLNYEVLLNMYHARRNHKLDEWRTFCGYIVGMPYFAEICLEDDDS
jgi:glycosyltransferase involved in cell wall biosynthesis